MAFSVPFNVGGRKDWNRFSNVSIGVAVTSIGSPDVLPCSGAVGRRGTAALLGGISNNPKD